MKTTLNDRQRRFCELVVSGTPGGRAYEEAGYDARGRTAEAAASRMLANVNVSTYLDTLRAEASDAAVMSIRERMEWLTEVVRTPLSEVDATSPLCVEHVTETFGKDGTREKIKKACPHKAIDTLNKMTGGYAPERHDHTLADQREALARSEDEAFAEMIARVSRRVTTKIESSRLDN